MSGLYYSDYYYQLSPVFPALNLVTPPTEYPLTINDLKSGQYLKDIDIDAESYDFENIYIPMATEKVEKWTGRKLLTQTWRATFDCPITEYRFPFGMLQDVTAVKIIQDDGTESIQDTESYSFTTGNGAKFWQRNNASWDSTNREKGNFEIVFVVGWQDAASLPHDIKANMHSVIASLYYDREDLVDQKATLFAGHSIMRT